jgi:hypothetical protein
MKNKLELELELNQKKNYIIKLFVGSKSVINTDWMMHLKRDTCCRIGLEIIESRGNNLERRAGFSRPSDFIWLDTLATKLYEYFFSLIQIKSIASQIGHEDFEKQNPSWTNLKYTLSKIIFIRTNSS